MGIRFMTPDQETSRVLCRVEDGATGAYLAWLRDDGIVFFVPPPVDDKLAPAGVPMLFARAIVNEFEKVWSKHEQAKLPNWVVGGVRFHTREEAWHKAWNWSATEYLEIHHLPPMPADINEANRLLRSSPWFYFYIEKHGDDPLLCTLDDDKSMRTAEGHALMDANGNLIAPSGR